MSTPMEQAVEVLCQYLQEQGLPARTAWPAESRLEVDTPVIAVSLRGCESAPAGFPATWGSGSTRTPRCGRSGTARRSP